MCMDALYDGQHHLGGNIPHRALRSPVVEVGPALVGPTSLPLRRGKHRGHRGHRGHCGCGVRRAVRRQQLTSVLGSTKRQKAYDRDRARARAHTTASNVSVLLESYRLLEAAQRGVGLRTMLGVQLRVLHQTKCNQTPGTGTK